jgi:hypothetical protein
MGVRRMRKPWKLGAYKQVIEETLTALGRNDVGVGDVAEKRAGTLAVAFSRWGHAQTVEVPIDNLQGQEQARVAIHRAIHDLSKAIEKETMENRIKIVHG